MTKEIPSSTNLPTYTDQLIIKNTDKTKKTSSTNLSTETDRLTNRKEFIDSNIETKNIHQITNAKLPNKIQPIMNLLNVVHQLIKLPENSKEMFSITYQSTKL